MRKKASIIGFISSLWIHLGIMVSILVILNRSELLELDSSGGTEVSSNISMEMMQRVEIQPEPVIEPIVDPIIEKPLIEVADPTVKPKPKKIELKEKPKTKPKQKISKPKVETKTTGIVGDANSKATSSQINSQQNSVVGAGIQGIASYRNKLIREIERYKKYPQRSQVRGEMGFVVIKFKLLDNGIISGAYVYDSSGFSSLDNAALSAVQSAKPIGERPIDMQVNQIIKINFQLN